MAAQGIRQAESPEMSAPSTELRLTTHEQLASLAYALWQARGCPEGSPDTDWRQAEQELTASRCSAREH